MTSQRKIDANRRNAENSTGPRTAAGKARSSRNALKTGIYASGSIIRGESPEALQLLVNQFTAEYHPVTPTERSLVDSLVHFEWLLRRYRWLETELWSTATNDTPYAQKDVSLMGYAFVNRPDIAKVHRLRNSAQRNFNEALDRLLRLRAIGHEAVDPIPLSLPRPAEVPQPPEVPAEPESLPQPVASEAACPEVGFVPSNSLPAPVPAPGEPREGD
jgi:hypothetical protein